MLSRNCLNKVRERTKYLSKDILCPGWDSNRVPPNASLRRYRYTDLFGELRYGTYVVINMFQGERKQRTCRVHAWLAWIFLSKFCEARVTRSSTATWTWRRAGAQHNQLLQLYPRKTKVKHGTHVFEICSLWLLTLYDLNIDLLHIRVINILNVETNWSLLLAKLIRYAINFLFLCI
jgi:hypothetical protein